MTRVAGLSQSASINIFANREQVYCLLCLFKLILFWFFVLWRLICGLTFFFVVVVVVVCFVGNGSTRSTS